MEILEGVTEDPTSPPPRLPLLTEEQAPRMRRWIAALRSSQYTQCQSMLRVSTPDGGGHCCLGVAAEQAIADGYDGRWTKVNAEAPLRLGDLFVDATDVGNSTALTPGLVDWYGFNGYKAPLVVACSQLGPGRRAERCDLWYLEDHNGTTCQEPVLVHATQLNDVFRWDFNQIADAFEAYYFGERQ